MKPLAFDTETALIRPALMAPPMTCLTWQRPGHEPRIDHVNDALPRIRSWLNDPATLLVGHFTAYDTTVICAEFPELVPAVFAAYRANRITCTKIRQQLLDIAGGVFRGRLGDKGRWITHKYDLADLSKRHLGKVLEKDAWRLRYAEFRDISLSQWVTRARELQLAAIPRAAELRTVLTEEAIAECKSLDALIADSPEGVIRYPLDDAAATLGVYLAQEKHADYLADQYRQTYAQFVLYLSSAWGLRTHGPGVESLRIELDEAYRELEEVFQGLGYIRPDGTRDMKRIKRLMIDTCRENGLPLRRTDGHEQCALGDACEEHVSLDSDACEAVALADPTCDLADYAELVALKKMLSNDVKMLAAGVTYPVHTRYDFAETGRTTSSKPNIQNLSAGIVKNKDSTAQRLRVNVRQAFIPRPGKVFAQADFPQLELYTLAQCCVSWLGFSELGTTLNAGIDPHLLLGAKTLGISYEAAAATKVNGKFPKEINHARSIGKVFNFGKPGGMGNKKFQIWARKTYGVSLTIEQLEQYTAQWHELFPEMRQYFARVNALFSDDNERASVVTLFTERHRGGATYCACCNNGFQALGVDCAKAAMCLVAEAEYCDTASPLYGSRTVAMVHDEFIAETDDTAGASAAAFELARLMTVGANRYLPDVPIPMAKMEPTLMRVWSKEAKQVWACEGNERRLIPWAP